MSNETAGGTANAPIPVTPPGSLLDRVRLDGHRPPPSLRNATIGVIRYELARSLTWMRALIWIALVLFPVALVTATLQIAQIRDFSGSQTLGAIYFLMFILLPQAVTVLNMLLFAAPIVNAELESQSWIYAIVRPRARKAILLGKYVVAVLWCGSCTTASTVIIAMVAQQYKIPEPGYLIKTLLMLCWLAAVCYGALFLAIGTFFQRRAMVYAFAYSIGVELLMGWIPAVVNLFTISYRLRSLLFSWMSTRQGIKIDDLPFQWEDYPLKHVAIMALIVIGLLGLSLWRIDQNQYRWQSEV